MADSLPPLLRVESLCVRLGERLILDGVSFDVEGHSTVAVVGASGCGKTTLLRTIAGLIVAERGRVTLRKERVDLLPANRRGIVYLNQEPLLFPHLNLFENIAFGLRLRGFSEEVIRERVAELLLRLELSGLEGSPPHALFGGQRQRAAFGRALAVEPALLLLDEPFSSLDPDTRTTMQDLFKRLAHELRIAALFVTHDVKECVRMGDRFALMRDGRVRLYSDLRTFCADPASGVAREAAFWQAFAAENATPRMGTPPPP